jgi:hypothetical protein
MDMTDSFHLISGNHVHPEWEKPLHKYGKVIMVLLMENKVGFAPVERKSA